MLGEIPTTLQFLRRRMATRFVSCSHVVGAYACRRRAVRDKAESRDCVKSRRCFRQTGKRISPALIIDLSTVDPFWSAHPMTRYSVLRAYLSEYRVERVINGETIYRRL